MKTPHASPAHGPTRRGLLVGAGLVGGGLVTAAAVDGFLVAPGRLLTTDHTLGGGARPRVRLVQVSDLHLRSMGRLETRLLTALHDSRADLLLFTGDMIDRRLDLWRLETFLRECPRVRGGSRSWATGSIGPGCPPNRSRGSTTAMGSNCS